MLCLLITGFFVIAGLLTVLGYAVARLIVPVTPAAGVLFLSGSFRDLALSWRQRVVKVLVMGPFAFLASLVLFAFTSAIFTARMPEGLRYLLILGLSWVAWAVAAPAHGPQADAPAGEEAARASPGHEAAGRLGDQLAYRLQPGTDMAGRERAAAEPIPCRAGA